ncbi:MAG: hypothetical protein HOC74_23095 [Gemmatimonadetes bacterium]|jgi:hypothetical protein|nr:hypothetical protein [Gemmatimonadota bacterium]
MNREGDKGPQEFEKGTTRRHTFFCINKARNTSKENVIEVVPKEITLFGQRVKGWLVTTEQPVIDKIIPLDESMRGDGMVHDPE